ncbi:MAG: hypothetical protein JWL67_1223 [Solirubrobacterales bacterium]|jgi:hypothetical protein|nr:hypothetical protein [Solirubrobacterales bacterium]
MASLIAGPLTEPLPVPDVEPVEDVELVVAGAALLLLLLLVEELPPQPATKIAATSVRTRPADALRIIGLPLIAEAQR